MDPQAIEQALEELSMVIALSEHRDPAGLFGLANFSLGASRLGA